MGPSTASRRVGCARCPPSRRWRSRSALGICRAYASSRCSVGGRVLARWRCVVCTRRRRASTSWAKLPLALRWGARSLAGGVASRCVAFAASCSCPRHARSTRVPVAGRRKVQSASRASGVRGGCTCPSMPDRGCFVGDEGRAVVREAEEVVVPVPAPARALACSMSMSRTDALSCIDVRVDDVPCKTRMRSFRVQARTTLLPSCCGCARCLLFPLPALATSSMAGRASCASVPWPLETRGVERRLERVVSSALRGWRERLAVVCIAFDPVDECPGTPDASLATPRQDAGRVARWGAPERAVDLVIASTAARPASRVRAHHRSSSPRIDWHG